MASNEKDQDAAPELELSAGIGFVESMPPLKDVKAWEQFDQERARQIDNDDLTRKNKQTHRGLVLLWAAFQSTGVIYGDIGTSPLYVFSSTFASHPSRDDIIGALSIVIWSLTLVVTVKYCLIVLRADDDGHGGTFALYSLLARHANISSSDPNTPNSQHLERYLTSDLAPAARSTRSILEKSRIAKSALKVIGLLGISMVLADGVLMPAQSVLGAVQGIRVARPDLGTGAVIGISCAILVLLFLIQPFGTAKIGTGFAPVVVVWLLFNLSSGIYNLVQHDHTVLRAFGPHYAFAYLVRNGHRGWASLGGLLLAFTGVEALFADLGAFGKGAIQLSWICLAYPCLIVTYAGQAAFIAADDDGNAYSNPFFYTVPPGTFYFSLVIAILAATVASQAMITSAFQLLSQTMRLSYFPHIKMAHTSQKFHEHVFLPFANWLLMIGSVIVTAVYNNTTSLGHAYGVCVMMTAFITTCMVALVALVVWRTPSMVVIPCFLVFIALDGAFLSAALNKVPEGGWFTLVLSFVIFAVFSLWRWGKEKQWVAEGKGSTVLPPPAVNLTPTVARHEEAEENKNEDREAHAPHVSLSQLFGGGSISLMPGIGVFFDKVGGHGRHIPKVFTHFVKKFRSRPLVIVLFHMRSIAQPTVPVDQRFVITRVSGVASCYRVTLRHGYTDDVLTPDLGRVLVRELVLYLTHGEPDVAADDMPPRVQEEMAALELAAGAQMVYIMGKQVLRIRRRDKKSAGRRIGLSIYLWLRENSHTKLADLNIDPNSFVEVGYVNAM